ncbi:UvrD-helicase domain-containing protein [Sphingobacterium thalpophilum]|uniref:UvrD-helicase domain-containing protein n=1 Tax=Sphingobacterium thalpophilum TaxID=259 RepID=UPI003DA271AA
MLDKVIPINGKNSLLDYEIFTNSVEATIGKNCKEFKIFIFNKFPVALTSDSTFDLLIFIAVKDKEKNYYRTSNGRYIHNLIIPVKLVDEFYDQQLVLEDSEIVDKSTDTVVDYSGFILSSERIFREYLKEKCGLGQGKLNLFPMIFIKQKKTKQILGNYILSENLSFDLMLECFDKSNFKYLNSYFPWKANYELFEVDIKKIIDQASKDSKYGYLTQKKLQRIAKKIVQDSNISSYVGNYLVFIEGKAGSGKSSELVQLMIQNLKSKKNALYLTYNKLLTYDIAKLVQTFATNYDTSEDPLKEYSVKTIHSFFFKICQQNNLLSVLSESRIEELMNDLKIKMRKIFDLSSSFEITGIDDFNTIMKHIQSSGLSLEVKEFGVNLMKYAYKSSLKRGKLPTFKELSLAYFEKVQSTLRNVAAKEVFLADYYNVLKNLKDLLSNPDRFYDDYDIANKVHLFKTEKQGINKRYLSELDENIIFTRDGFREYNNRRFGGHKRNRILFIDEGQDCADIERDILYELFGTSNIVVASGGVEQLIRHKRLCNWANSRVPYKRFTKQARSFRVKKAIVDLCNFIAGYFDLPYKLTSDSSDDEGEVIIDFRMHTIGSFQPILKQKTTSYSALGFTNYEGCMILLDSSSLRNSASLDNEQREDGTEKIYINEYNNITYSKSKNRKVWDTLPRLAAAGYEFWDGTQKDKDQLLLPSPNEIRTLYYESCRGLEAWSVFCFDIDVFFNVKCNEDEADKFMLDDMFTDVESRRKRFATHWILMAMTRAMDTLYLQVNEIGSELGQALNQYVEQNKAVRCFK